MHEAYQKTNIFIIKKEPQAVVPDLTQ